jgi:beta-lactamase superfamily II metal-dependent hydrolase
MPARVLPSVSPYAGEVRVDIVDVGHGSCVVVRAGSSVVVIDTGPNGALLEYLLVEGIEKIDAVIISHADADHIGGLSALLGQGVPIGRVIWNGDSIKGSDIWGDLIFQLDDLHEAGKTVADEEAKSGLTVTVGDDVAIAILAPRLRLRRLGAGATDHGGRRITTNSVSVVAQVIVDGESLLIVPGDLDSVGYSHLTDNDGVDLRARYLVLPHHGGLMGSADNTAELIRELVEAVQPELVFVSNGRGRYSNPRVDVLAAARSVIPTLPVACTQLSKLCSANAIARDGASSNHAAGWLKGLSCAATTRLTRGNGIGADVDRRQHIEFIRDYVPSAICV